MASIVDTRLAELLCSRICHDMVNPVGAINNGIELIEELGASVIDEATELIGSSARKVTGHLKFYRMAYGFAGSRSIQSFREVRDLVQGILEDGTKRLAWPDAALPPAPPAPGWGKLLLNLVALATEGLPGGGTLGVAVSSTPTAHRFEVAARGDKAGLTEELTAALDPEIAVERLTARTVQAYFSAVLAARLGARIDVASSPNRFQITAAPIDGA
ncbi:MAG: histidine phosphotransferase family protein [Kiloniellales bacterium]